MTRLYDVELFNKTVRVTPELLVVVKMIETRVYIFVQNTLGGGGCRGHDIVDKRRKQKRRLATPLEFVIFTVYEFLLEGRRFRH